MNAKCCDCCHPEPTDSRICSCCDGIEKLTPISTYNRPGLDEINYRIGRHGSFMQTMQACLSSSEYPKLAELTTRDTNDPSIALLDAWATVADVLTFYQERIANEGYLRTATERRSVLELARLVGYRLRPGVASSVYLAYTLDENAENEVTIPAGSRAQSVPEPDELPQVFETSDDLKARLKWNNLKPRLTQPQSEDSIKGIIKESIDPDHNTKRPSTARPKVLGPRVYLKGINTNLRINDPLLVDFGGEKPNFARVVEIFPDPIADHTLVTLELNNQQGRLNDPAEADYSAADLLEDLTLQPSLQPRGSLRLSRTLKEQFEPRSGTGYRLAAAFSPVLQDSLTDAVSNANVTDPTKIKVFALRLEAPLFGHNVPRRTKINIDTGVIEDAGDWPVIQHMGDNVNFSHENETSVFLDNRYDGIQLNSWIVIETQLTERLTDKKSFIVKASKVDASQHKSRYGISGPTTYIELDFLNPQETPKENRWIKIFNYDVQPPVIKEASEENGEIKFPDDFNAVRSTTVYAQPEELELAEEPIEFPICGGSNDLIELDGFYEDLESGRWVIVSGEREIQGTSGVRFSELAMLSSVTHDICYQEQTKITDNQEGEEIEVKELVGSEDEKIHTFIKLAEDLNYCFKRDTITIYGNVAKATHGETRQEVLGSGDGAQALQSFELKQFPLTHVSASNPSGVDSTLKAFVNDVRWHETPTLADRQPTDRNFITQTDNKDKTKIIFGDGNKGSRVPSGIENISTEYRSGIGKPGNVKAEQISLLQTKPLGVKDVINPLRASGGADRENINQARKNAPLAIKALDRLVSVSDYEDFSRTYAGIGKASAVELSDGQREVVYVTIAGSDDIPIDETSDLYRNLRSALHEFGDLHQPIQLAIRELVLMVISARIRIQANYQWESVAMQLRETLLNKFSFDSRELGQDVFLSEVISVMQAVRGVEYVDVDVFGGVPEKAVHEVTINGETRLARRLQTPEEISQSVQALLDDSNDNTGLNQHIIVNATSTLMNNHNTSLQSVPIQPAQLAYLTPNVPETLILNQITEQ